MLFNPKLIVKLGSFLYKTYMEYKGLEIIRFANKQQWLDWLEINHNKYPDGIWVRLAKKGSTLTSLSYVDLREGCLIYGWIDGLVNAHDNQEYFQRVTPRRARSTWSKINCEIIEGLIQNHTIKPSGLRVVEAAKKDGRWDMAYESPKNMTVPEDFVDAVKKDPDTYGFFKSLSKANTFAIAFRLNTAQKPETRKKDLTR